MNKDNDIINVHITKDTKGSIYTIKDALHHSSIETSKHYISGKEQRIDKAAEAAGVFFSSLAYSNNLLPSYNTYNRKTALYILCVK